MGQTPFENPTAEGMRLKGLYRRLILEGRIKLPRRALNGLIGPDCAYHLYGRFDISGRADIIISNNDKQRRRNTWQE